MKNRFLIICLFLIFLPFSTFAQMPAGWVKAKTVDHLSSSNLYFLETEDPFWNAALEDALKAHWTLAPYRMLPRSEFDVAMRNRDAYYLEELTEIRTEGVTSTETKYLVLMRGNPKLDKRTNKADVVSIFPLDIITEVNGIRDMQYRLMPFIKLMNDALIALKEKKTKVKTIPKAMKFISKNLTQPESLANKTLLIREESLKPEDYKRQGIMVSLKEYMILMAPTKAEVEAAYNHPHEIVEAGDIEEALLERRKDTAVLINLTGRHNYQFIFDAETHNCLYVKYKKNGSMREKDYARLVE